MHVSHVSGVPARLGDEAKPGWVSPVSRVVSPVPACPVSKSVSRQESWPAAFPIFCTYMCARMRVVTLDLPLGLVAAAMNPRTATKNVSTSAARSSADHQVAISSAVT